MKKTIKRIIIIFSVILIIQLIMLVFKTQHEIQYEIKNNKETFKITETYKNKAYHFKINMNKKNFTFYTNHNYHKKEKVLKEIEYYQKDNLICIYPVIENTNIICSENNTLLSYNIIQNKTKEFVQELKKKGYQHPSWNEKEQNYTTLEQIEVDTNAINENTNIYIWKYNGFYSVGKELETLNTFEKDTYLNNLGIKVGNYYVVADYDQKYDFNKFYIYNMKNNKKKELKLKQEISKDSYILGVVEEKLYIFDKDELKEYEINPKKRKIKEVGNKKDGGLFYDGKEFKKVSIYEFNKDEPKYFQTDTSYLQKVVDKTTLNYINKNNDIFYYYDKDNKFWLQDSITNQKILLFNQKVSDIQMLENDIYYIVENKIYEYKENEKAKEIIKYEELNFNSKNRFTVYKK